MPEFTPTQRRILRLLSDGKPHTKEEVKGCLGDELASMSAVYFQISRLRQKLATKGEDIVYATNGFGLRKAYRHVRLLHDPSDE